MALQLNIFVLTLGLIQSLLVGLALFRQKRSHPSRIYLVLFLLVIGLQLAFKIISKAWLWYHARTIYMISYNFGYLIGPLIYLLLRSRRDVLFKRADLIHFIPFLVSTVITLIDELFGYEVPSSILYLIPWPSWQLLSMVAYGYASWKLANDEPELKSSLKRFIILSLTIEAIIVITISILVRNLQSLPDIRMIFVALTFLIYLISYKLFTSPQIFALDLGKAVIKLDVNTVSKYANSGLNSDEAHRILERLKHCIEKEKIYLQHDLSLDQVARKLEVKRHHLSQVINVHYNKSFTDLITTLRLDLAQAKILEHLQDDYKLAAIAFDSGFNSISSFTNIFKRRFGLSPSEFRERSRVERRQTS